MTRSGGGGGDTYRCGIHQSGFACPAPAGIVAARIEEYVERVVVRDLLAQLERRSFRGIPRSSVADLATQLARAEAEVDAYIKATSAVDNLDADAFASGLRQRTDAVERAREALRVEQDQAVAVEIIAGGEKAWARLSPSGRNSALRGVVDAIAVKHAGRGRRVPVEDRVAIFLVGSGIELPVRRAGDAAGPHPIDCDDPRAFRVLAVERGA
jgi:hypothetical protein